MAASALTLYSINKNHINTSDLAGATVKLALFTSTYTPDASVTGDSIYSGISANEIANGNGYTTGGVTPGTNASTAITSGYKFTTANAVWTASGGNIPAWRYGVLYVSGSLWGLTSPLIGYFLGDNTPADIPATSGVLTITANASGWFDIT